MQQILGFDVLVSEETCVAVKALFSIRYKHNYKHKGGEDAQKEKHNHERMSRINDSLISAPYLLDTVKQYGGLLHMLRIMPVLTATRSRLFSE